MFTLFILLYFIIILASLILCFILYTIFPEYSLLYLSLLVQSVILLNPVRFCNSHLSMHYTVNLKFFILPLATVILFNLFILSSFFTLHISHCHPRFSINYMLSFFILFSTIIHSVILLHLNCQTLTLLCGKMSQTNRNYLDGKKILSPLLLHPNQNENIL